MHWSIEFDWHVWALPLCVTWSDWIGGKRLLVRIGPVLIHNWYE